MHRLLAHISVSAHVAFSVSEQHHVSSSCCCHKTGFHFENSILQTPSKLSSPAAVFLLKRNTGTIEWILQVLEQLQNNAGGEKEKKVSEIFDAIHQEFMALRSEALKRRAKGGWKVFRLWLESRFWEGLWWWAGGWLASLSPNYLWMISVIAIWISLMIIYFTAQTIWARYERNIEKQCARRR